MARLLDSLCSALSFSLHGRTRLKAQHDITELNAITIVQIAALKHGPIIDARPVRGSVDVAQQKALPHSLNNRVLLLDLHIAEQGNVGMFIPAQQILYFIQRIFSSFLPAA